MCLASRNHKQGSSKDWISLDDAAYLGALDSPDDLVDRVVRDSQDCGALDSQDDAVDDGALDSQDDAVDLTRPRRL